MTLTSIEDALLARAAVRLGDLCRACVPLPGGLEQLAAVLGTTLLTPPCLAAVWRGWQRPVSRERGLDIAPAGLHGVSQWSLIAIVATPAGELTRRRGEPARGLVGAYQLAELAAQALHDHTIPAVGTVRVAHLAPIEDEALRGRGLSVAEVRLSLAHDLAEFDASVLPDWVTAEVTMAHPCPGTPTPDTWTLGPLPTQDAPGPRLDDAAVGATEVPGAYLLMPLAPGAEE